MKLRFEPIFSLRGWFGVEFFPIVWFSIWSLSIEIWLRLRHEALKAIGGGSRPKFWFYVILVANLVYFHLLFTEFENSDPLTQNWRICPGGWGLPGVHFRPFGEICWQKSQKSAPKCTWMSFEWLIMIKEVFQRVKTRNSVTYLQAGASQSS